MKKKEKIFEYAKNTLFSLYYKGILAIWHPTKSCRATLRIEKTLQFSQEMRKYPQS